MTEEEERRYRAHMQALLNQNSKTIILSEISDDDLIAELGRRLKAEKMAILGSAEALKGGIQSGWY